MRTDEMGQRNPFQNSPLENRALSRADALRMVLFIEGIRTLFRQAHSPQQVGVARVGVEDVIVMLHFYPRYPNVALGVRFVQIAKGLLLITPQPVAIGDVGRNNVFPLW